MPIDLTKPNDLNQLIEYSAQIGNNPMLIQAAGGNTSIKEQNVMWIKASGTLLADANDKDIFVPVDLQAMRNSVQNGEERADRPVEFALGDSSLRPSIETSLHAVFKQRVVIHVHCVQTLAHAIRADCRTIIAKKLANFNWCMVPYRKPGANLAEEVRQQLQPDTDVAILANHGLLIAADSVSEAEILLNKVTEILTIKHSDHLPADTDQLKTLLPSIFEVPENTHVAHQLALNDQRILFATGGSLYPDHVIFCGPGSLSLRPDEVLELSKEDAPIFVIVPNLGVLVRRDASDGARALIQCLADVILRLPSTTDLNYLSNAQNHELMNWDAEKYRQAMDVK